jgi:NADPH2:quinone reductase
VLVKNEFIGVNFIDTYFRSGLYPRPSYPSGLGEEGAGTVEAVGPGEELQASWAYSI